MLNHETNELLKQEVTDDELRELLQRLGENEFDWSPKTTVADVVEATSSDPLAVGRLLAEIRKEDWEERFGLRLTDVEERINRIEDQRHPAELPSLHVEPRPFERTPPILKDSDYQSSQPVILALVILGTLIALLMIFGTGHSQAPPDFTNFRPG